MLFVWGENFHVAFLKITHHISLKHHSVHCVNFVNVNSNFIASVLLFKGGNSKQNIT